MVDKVIKGADTKLDKVDRARVQAIESANDENGGLARSASRLDALKAGDRSEDVVAVRKKSAALLAELKAESSVSGAGAASVGLGQPQFLRPGEISDSILNGGIYVGSVGASATDEASFFSKALDFTIGVPEVFLSGIYNGAVETLGGVVSVPYFLFGGVDSAVDTQNGFNEFFSYNVRSRGAKNIYETITPAAQYVSGKIDSLRNLSENYVGDGFTTYVFASYEAGIGIAATLTGTKGITSIVKSASRVPNNTSSLGINGGPQISPGPFTKLSRSDNASNDIVADGSFSYLPGNTVNGVDYVGQYSSLDVTKNVKPGEFNIVDWKGYPDGVPKPNGPVRLIEGAEYDAARKAANSANRKIRQQNNLKGQPVDVHEVQPVKFGGSATDPANKVIIDRSLHRQQVTPWWNQLQKDVGG